MGVFGPHNWQMMTSSIGLGGVTVSDGCAAAIGATFEILILTPIVLRPHRLIH